MRTLVVRLRDVAGKYREVLESGWRAALTSRGCGAPLATLSLGCGTLSLLLRPEGAGQEQNPGGDEDQLERTTVHAP